jgi:TetR/AcrR family transcriptional repressor of nem operon
VLDTRTTRSQYADVKERKGQILDIAARLISERGFHHTSVDDVIDEAGLSGKSHFYHYFPSKEEMGYAVLERQFGRFADRGVAILREPMIDPLERLALFIDSLVVLQAERGCKGGSALGTLAAEMADSHEGFRQRIDLVFVRWAEQIQSLLREARPQLRDGVDEARLATFIIAALEGAMLMTRIKREIGVMQGVASDLKRFIGMHVRERATEVARQSVRAEPSAASVATRS